MAGKSPAEAFRAFRRPMQQSLSCVSSTAVFVGSPQAAQPGPGRSIKVPAGQGFVPLHGERLHLSAVMEYEVVRDDRPERGPWKIHTTKYMYHVVSDDHTEVVLFHWHPDTPGADRGTHLHVGSSQLSPSAVLSSHGHLPTGRVAFESVLALLIRDFGVIPARTDWQSVMADNLVDFERWRTWP